ncbi:MAG: hypothetical protein L0Z73_14175 [Gammaproteobacteria bacterium]|nr:hypothetical protein [Gammaproteobacteria bacterium]
MGAEAKLAIPALVTIYLEDVDVVRVIARDALSKIVPNLDITLVRRIYSTKHRDPKINNSASERNNTVAFVLNY